MRTRRWKVTAFLFGALSILWAALAWNGDNVPLVGLCVTALITSFFVGLAGSGWRTALEGWKRSTNSWSATQDWGFRNQEILHETINELREYDEEAAVISLGRNLDNNADYMALMREEEPSLKN